MIKNFEIHAAEIFDPGAPLAVERRPASSPGIPPLHLRSALKGSSANPAGPPVARPGSPRPGSPRPGSPRYMQATTASSSQARIRKPTIDAAQLPPAGGAPYRTPVDSIDHSSDGDRHTMRRSFSLPRRSHAATIASIAAPPRGPGNLESPRFARDSALFAESSSLPAYGGGGGGGGPPASKRPPLSRPSSSHDKTIPNPRRTQKAAGLYQPAPPISSVAALAAAEGMIQGTQSGGAFATNPMPRRGPGGARPDSLRPAVNAINPSAAESSSAFGNSSPRPTITRRGYTPPPERTNLRDAGYVGMASGSQVDNLLGGRKAAGICSPRNNANPIAWG